MMVAVGDRTGCVKVCGSGSDGATGLVDGGGGSGGIYDANNNMNINACHKNIFITSESTSL